MKKTFYGHTPNVNGLLNLDRSDMHIHNIDAKRCKVDNDSATYGNSMQMDFWNHLIMNHLILGNRALWER